MQLIHLVKYIVGIPTQVLERYGRELILFLIAFFISGSIAIVIVYKTLYWKASHLTYHPAPIDADHPSSLPTQPSPQVTISTGTALSENSKQVGGLININSATLIELDSLPGIGPVYAQRIVDMRPFASVQSITRVPGIGQKTFKKIEALITVE